MSMLLMTDYCVRALEQKDIDAILLMDQVDNPYPWPKQVMLETLTQQDISLQASSALITPASGPALKQKRYHWIIENNAEKICGYLLTSHLLNEADVELIVVSQYERRQGLAKKLMHTWLANIRTKGIELAMLEVRESNLGAIALYEQLGFLKVGLRKNYYVISGGAKESAVLMNLDSVTG